MIQQHRFASFALVTLFAVSTACSSADQPSRTGGSGDEGGSSGSGGTGDGGTGGGGKGGSSGSGGGGTGGMKKDGGATPDSGEGGAGGEPDGGAGSGGNACGAVAAAVCTVCMGDYNYTPDPKDPTKKDPCPDARLPAKIKDTGIFSKLPDLTAHAANLIPFAPGIPLWSDGMEKQRMALIPAGTKIDNTMSDKAWVFPVGTVFIKTFFDDSGAGGKARPIETRLIRFNGDTALYPYQFFVYQWNADGTDADLVMDDEKKTNNDPGTGVAGIDVPITINRMVNGQPFTVNGGKSFKHTLPSKSMCMDCHNENGNSRQHFIGFDEARLSFDMNGTNADPKTWQITALAAKNLFMKAPRTTPETITDPDPVLQRIKRFVFGNCVHCHDGSKVFDMNPDMFVANTVNMDTDSQSVETPKTGPSSGWKRILPKMPLKSVLYVQVQRTMVPALNKMPGFKLRAMPPVGVADVAAQQAALTDLLTWINSLK
jgi:hypothetical protein